MVNDTLLTITPANCQSFSSYVLIGGSAQAVLDVSLCNLECHVLYFTSATLYWHIFRRYAPPTCFLSTILRRSVRDEMEDRYMCVDASLCIGAVAIHDRATFTLAVLINGLAFTVTLSCTALRCLHFYQLGRRARFEQPLLFSST